MVPPDDSRCRWVALIVCCSALFMTLLDVSVTNVALPSIGDDTGAGTVRSCSGSSPATPWPSGWCRCSAASSATTTGDG